MSKKPKLGSVFSSRKNPETGKVEIYEIPPEEVEESFNRTFQTLEELPPTKSQRPKTTEGEARRGAHNARRFLAENPTQEENQSKWEWTWDEKNIGCGCPACLSYVEAYQKVLRRRLT